MNFEILKNISETCYINFNDIRCGIKEKSPNIYMRFRTATEELLLQINKKYNFVEEGEGFFNRIINNHEFQYKLLMDYKCDRKIMSCINRIKELGNKNTHNELKIFDTNDVKECLFRLLILARKVLEFERGIYNKFNFTRDDINEEIDSLIISSDASKTKNSKEKFVETIHQYDDDLLQLYSEFYNGNGIEFLDKYKELISIILNYVISFDPKYQLIEDLKIGEYSNLYKIYEQYDILYNETLDVARSYIYDYTFTLRNILNRRFDIDILEWILIITCNKEIEQINDADTETEILKAVNAVTNSEYPSYDIKNGYYVESQRLNKCKDDYYYIVELKKTRNDQSRGNTVYSKIKLPSNYALEITLKETSINILGCTQKEYIVVDYRVAIRPAEINGLIRAITGQKVSTRSTEKFYITLMNYIQNNNCTILDILTSNDKKYNEFLLEFNGITSEAFVKFKEAMNKARQKILLDEFESGANILRYVTYFLRREILVDQINKKEMFKDLYFHKGSYRFDRNPFSFALKQHTPKVSDLYECINIKDYESDIFVRKLSDERKNNDTLFNDLSEYPKNAIELINDYNAKIRNTKNDIGKLEIFDNKVYRVSEYDEMIQIKNELKNKQIDSNLRLIYQKEKDKFLKENILDSDDKIKTLNESFKESKVSIVLGEAGTGKTELLCNYFTNIFGNIYKDEKNFKLLYIANTHAALNNMRRRVKQRNPHLIDHCIFKVAKYFEKNYLLFNNIKTVIIDECKVIPNKTMHDILNKLDFDYCILAGDVAQLDAIDLGNWFKIISKSLPQFVKTLSKNNRTTNKGLREAWNKVRNNSEDTLKYLWDNNYIEPISNKIFEKKEGKEVILCLNYVGTYGIKSMNEYFQNQNQHKAYKNDLNVYKVEDHVVFNQNANNAELYNNYIYNNLNGVIKEIKEDLEKLEFTIRVDTYIPSNDETKRFLQSSNEKENWSYIKILLKKYSKEPIEEDDETDYLCPFDVTYAMSIHKAQGLEFDSVKIIITPESEEVINNAIFYTAITRAKERLKIYLTNGGIEKMEEILSRTNNSNDAELIKELEKRN